MHYLIKPKYDIIRAEFQLFRSSHKHVHYGSRAGPDELSGTYLTLTRTWWCRVHAEDGVFVAVFKSDPFGLVLEQKTFLYNSQTFT